MEIRNTLYTGVLSTLLLFERAENFFSFSSSSPRPPVPYTFLHLIFVRFFFLFSTFGFSSRALISYSRRCLQVQLLWRNFGVWRRENGTGRVRIHVDTGKNGGPPFVFRRQGNEKTIAIRSVVQPKECIYCSSFLHYFLKNLEDSEVNKKSKFHLTDLKNLIFRNDLLYLH